MSVVGAYLESAGSAVTAVCSVRHCSIMWGNPEPNCSSWHPLTRVKPVFPLTGHLHCYVDEKNMTSFLLLLGRGPTSRTKSISDNEIYAVHRTTDSFPTKNVKGFALCVTGFGSFHLSFILQRLMAMASFVWLPSIFFVSRNTLFTSQLVSKRCMTCFSYVAFCVQVVHPSFIMTA